MNMNLGLMRATSRILRSDRSQNNQADARIHPAASVRLVTALVCILLCALSKNAWFTVSVIAVELVLTAVKPAESIARILKPVFLALLFAAVFTCPAVFLGSPGSFGSIVMKTAESVLVLSRMNEDVPWKETTGALQAFHLPGVVIATLDQTIRFLVILGRFSDRMLEAVSLRRVGKKKWNNAGTGGIVGTTFLKSQRMAQYTSEAMACRGFTGNYFFTPKIRQKKQTAVNIAYLMLVPLLFVCFLYTQSLM